VLFFSFSEREQNTLQACLYFKQRCLIIVKRIEQTKDNGNGCMTALEKRGKTFCNRGLHLITGKGTRDKNVF